MQALNHVFQSPKVGFIINHIVEANAVRSESDPYLSIGGSANMKVIAIVGSPRKNGNTELLTAHTLKAIAEEGLDTELIPLADKEIKPCNACMVC